MMNIINRSESLRKGIELRIIGEEQKHFAKGYEGARRYHLTISLAHT